jgi:hypothetical protein
MCRCLISRAAEQPLGEVGVGQGLGHQLYHLKLASGQLPVRLGGRAVGAGLRQKSSIG